MKKITNYMVVSESGGDISVKIKQLIGHGWQPLGGVSVVLTEGARYGGIQSMISTFYQAMVIYES